MLRYLTTSCLLASALASSNLLANEINGQTAPLSPAPAAFENVAPVEKSAEPVELYKSYYNFEAVPVETVPAPAVEPV